ncbi:MAG: type II toxin-antitoxin system prevent-host-death family antitoxin [Chloroflexi bacterium]|nr:type II toxin-antitoxin system prevent-host-death family antitoxin [Chloroflexota bacterium]
MKQVGVRELKARLSEYLALVKAGEEVVVTERGKPVARLAPLPSYQILPQHLAEMERLGLVRRGSGQLPDNFWELPRFHDLEGRAVKALLAEREEGR